MGMRIGRSAFIVGSALWLIFSQASPALSQLQAPLYEECRLDAIFPNGGSRGSTVKIEFKGFGAGLTSPREIVIDGPPGLEVKEIKSVNGSTVEAIVDIAADAPLGRRWLRVLNERSGLTNFSAFIVGGLPELIETEPNNNAANPETVSLPLVINGRINPQADLDVYRFTGKAGQRLVAGIAAHALDVHGQYKNYGIADFSLELLDDQGRTLAAAEDTIGYDPVIEQTLPADGDYFVRVQLLNYGGFPEAVYRLTLGDVPYPFGTFPAGLQRGMSAEVEVFGFGGVPPTKLTIADQMATAFPLRYVALPDTNQPGLDLPLVVGTHPEIPEAPANDERTSATVLSWPVTVNGRFEQPNDADWYRVTLAAQQKVWYETIAQRFVRSPVDTLIQVYDANGQMLGENDDEVFDPNYEAYHDFKTTDSKLLFAAPVAGDYFVKVSEQNGTSGQRAIYRMTVEEARAGFRLTHFPDAVPIWGPGSTACVLVRADRFAGCDDDIEIAVEGLPAGWSTSSATSLGGKGVRPYNTYQLKVFVTITAPPDAQPGTCVPFRIVGRVRNDSGDVVLECESIPLNLFYTSDTGFFRVSPQSRAAVAKSQGPWLERVTPELTLAAGASGAVTVKVRGPADLKEMPIVVNLATAGVACGLTTPQNLPIRDGLVEVPIKLPPEIAPGVYGITVAQTWRSDIRIGMPGPCTPLIRLTVPASKP